MKALIVNEYSKRDLTIKGDKKAAISGIATRIGRLRNDDTLIAGLWKGDLLKELSWQRGLDDFLRPPKEYRAPSWSWLSVDRIIDIHRRDAHKVRETPWARVDKVRVNRINGEPLSSIHSGRIILRGAAKSIRWTRLSSARLCLMVSNSMETSILFLTQTKHSTMRKPGVSHYISP
jgi:hypothetical protein